MSMLDLSAMRKVARVRKRRDNLAIGGEGCVPSAVVEVQMRVDDDIDFFERNPSRSERSRQLLLRIKDFPYFGWKLVTDAGLDHHRMLPGPNHNGIQPKQYPVEFIGRRAPLPKGLGYDAKHRAAIQKIRSVAEH